MEKKIKNVEEKEKIMASYVLRQHLTYQPFKDLKKLKRKQYRLSLGISKEYA
jgi:hypothetical protein